MPSWAPSGVRGKSNKGGEEEEDWVERLEFEHVDEERTGLGRGLGKVYKSKQWLGRGLSVGFGLKTH